MKLTFSNHAVEHHIEDPKPMDIQNTLKSINAESNCYFILTSEKGSYIQCAGDANKLCVEFREMTGKSFKHYILGVQRSKKKEMQIRWDTIHCHVGPIRVHDNEVLKLRDAIEIFYCFLDNGDVPQIFQRRNVTKYFTK
jgi:hypothetical protein